MEVPGFDTWATSISEPLARLEAEAAANEAEALTRLLKHERRHRAPRLMDQLRSRAERFCRLAHDPHGPPGFREAGEMLRRYGRGAISDAEFATWLNGKLSPVTRRVVVVDGSFSIDDGGAVDGYGYLAQLLQEGVALQRIKVCAHCDVLWYDASPRGDMRYCLQPGCRRARWRANQRRARHAE